METQVTRQWLQRVGFVYFKWKVSTGLELFAMILLTYNYKPVKHRSAFNEMSLECIPVRLDFTPEKRSSTFPPCFDTCKHFSDVHSMVKSFGLGQSNPKI